MSYLKIIGSVLKHVYQHFFGVLGALSIAALIASLQLYEWPFVINGLIEWWQSISYPVVDFLFSRIVELISNIIGVELSLNDVARDYLGVGVVFCFSRFRGALFGWQRKVGTGDSMESKPDPSKAVKSIARKPWKALSLGFSTLFLWPLESVHLARLAFFARAAFPQASDDYIQGVRVSHLASLLPVFYLAILVLISWANTIVEFLPDRESSKRGEVVSSSLTRGVPIELSGKV